MPNKKRKDPIEKLIERVTDKVFESIGNTIDEFVSNTKKQKENPFNSSVSFQAEAKVETEKDRFENAKDITSKVRQSTK